MRGYGAIRGRVKNLHIGEKTPIIPEDMGKTGKAHIYVYVRSGPYSRRGDNRGEHSITAERPIPAVSSETTKTAYTY